MSKTKSQVQFEALNAIKLNNYIGTCVIDTGGGKTKLGLDILTEFKAQKVLIVKPAILLTHNWKVEISNWLTVADENIVLQSYGFCLIDIENIQTVYKWSIDKIAQYDFIILDEIHTIVTPVYKIFLDNVDKLNIKRVGLTATPDETPEKMELYNKYCPIVFNYNTSAKDGIINNRKYYILEYELSDYEYILINNKNKSFYKSEKEQYEYYNNMVNEMTTSIKLDYFNRIKNNYIRLLSNLDKTPFANYNVNIFTVLNRAFSKSDFEIEPEIHPLQNFINVVRPVSVYSKELRNVLNHIKLYPYYKLGMEVLNHLKVIDKEIGDPDLKKMLSKYWIAIKKRKELLWSLPTSAKLAGQLKNYILSNTDGKVLIFSARKEQCYKYSSNVIHGELASNVCDTLMDNFNTGVIRDLASVEKINLGINFKNVKYAILESYDSSNVKHNQKIGRTDRLPTHETAVVVILCPKNTQAKEWLNNSMIKAVEKGYEIIYVNDINEIIL